MEKAKYRIWEAVCHRIKQSMKNPLPKLLSLFTGNPWRAFSIGFFTVFFIPFFLGHYLPLIKENSDFKASFSSCVDEKSKLETENKLCRDKLNNVLDENDEKGTDLSVSAFQGFMRDWDYLSSFYIPKGTTLLCPKDQGGRNYQRIYYKQDIVPKDAKLALKLRMIDEPGVSGYEQRFVTGLAEDQKILSEFDIPTRLGEVVSFREASVSGELVSLQNGTEIASPIKEGTVINLIHEIKHKQGKFLTQTIRLEYLPAIEKYGVQKPEVPYDAVLDDANPSSFPLKLFIGSYVGGCLEILDWSLTF